jgi:hypothetical protein
MTCQGYILENYLIQKIYALNILGTVQNITNKPFCIIRISCGYYDTTERRGANALIFNTFSLLRYI